MEVVPGLVVGAAQGEKDVVRQSTPVGRIEVGTDEVLLGRWPLEVLPLIVQVDGEVELLAESLITIVGFPLAVESIC